MRLCTVAALGAFVASSDSEMADVECFSSADADAEAIDIPGCKSAMPWLSSPAFSSPRVLSAVNTETYHAQYHVLEAFSFFNMILSESSLTRRFFDALS